ncbi:MAG: hypothetical protein E6R04_01075 [Spirochaetes bacterium]|nr:MAG: hypothetical protein E6R04_01075 [Spirochaetota bacterium]
MNKTTIKALSGVRPVRNLLAADAGDYLKVNGETVVIVQRTSTKGRKGTVEWIARNALGKSIVLTAKDAENTTRPELLEALLVRTTLLASGIILPVSKHLKAESVAA